MVRLAFSVLLVAVVIQVAASYNFNRLWASVDSSSSDQRIGPCLWTWLKTLNSKGYNCESDDSDESYPMIQISSQYVNAPYKDPIFRAVLPNIPCTLPKNFKVPNSAVLCGNGWYKQGRNWCVCQGTLSCIPAPTTTKATTTKATTTTPAPPTTKAQATPAPAPTTTKAQATPAPAPTTTTTQATPAPAPTTTTTQATPAPAPTTTTTTAVPTTLLATTPPLIIVPTISSSDVAAGSNIILQARATYTVTFTVTASPVPNSVTLGLVGGIAAPFVLSGSQGSLPDTYSYSFTFAVADSSYVGQWSVTADNGHGTPAVYTFGVDINYYDFTSSAAGSPQIYNVPASQLIAFQTTSCYGMVLTLGPALSDFNLASYTSLTYVRLDFSDPQSFYAWNTLPSDTFYLPSGTQCPASGDSPVPFWVMLQLTPLGGDQYNVDLWTSEKFQYTSSSNSTTVVSFQTDPSIVTYQIQTIAFDILNGATPHVYSYYDDAV